MTELETMQRAKMYIDKLARGIDPITNREIEEDSVLNNVRLARCFFYVSDILGQVIANGGVVSRKSKPLNFSITQEQLARVQVSNYPVTVSKLIQNICAAVGDPQMKQFSATVITDWLLEKGFLEKDIGSDGKSKRVPTENGRMIGLNMETRQGQHGMYQTVYYNTEAQQFVLDNLFAMLDDK